MLYFASASAKKKHSDPFWFVQHEFLENFNGDKLARSKKSYEFAVIADAGETHSPLIVDVILRESRNS